MHYEKGTCPGVGKREEVIRLKGIHKKGKFDVICITSPGGKLIRSKTELEKIY